MRVLVAAFLVLGSGCVTVAATDSAANRHLPRRYKLVLPTPLGDVQPSRRSRPVAHRTRSVNYCPSAVDCVSVGLLGAAVVGAVSDWLPAAAPWVLAFVGYLVARIGRDMVRRRPGGRSACQTSVR